MENGFSGQSFDTSIPPYGRVKNGLLNNFLRGHATAVDLNIDRRSPASTPVAPSVDYPLIDNTALTTNLSWAWSPDTWEKDTDQQIGTNVGSPTYTFTGNDRGLLIDNFADGVYFPAPTGLIGSTGQLTFMAKFEVIDQNGNGYDTIMSLPYNDSWGDPWQTGLARSDFSNSADAYFASDEFSYDTITLANGFSIGGTKLLSQSRNDSGNWRLSLNGASSTSSNLGSEAINVSRNPPILLFGLNDIGGSEGSRVRLKFAAIWIGRQLTLAQEVSIAADHAQLFSNA